MRKIVLLIIALLLSAAIFSTFAAQNTKAQIVSGSTQLTLYAGELYSGNGSLAHGAFGLTTNNLTSPGPTLYLISGNTVNLTLTNIGKVGHSFAITDQPATNATKLFNATIANATNPLAPGNSSSVMFTVGAPGLYYYICQVPGHVSLGMWGTVIVGNSNNASMSLFAGELYDANNSLAHGAFSLTPNNLSSPGPILYLTSGTTLNMTLTNIGKVGHTWAITSQPAENATKLFNATIGNLTTPVTPGNSSSVRFTIGQPGQYYYICFVPGHVALGMWGAVTVIPNATTTATQIPSISVPNPPINGTTKSVQGATPNLQTILYAGELYDANKTLVHGAFGLSMANITSPGPTLCFTTGTTVNLTLVNIGKVGHSFAITDLPATNATRLFNATIANGTNPVAPGNSSSIIFTVGAPGLYYYICQVPGHVSLGMWGLVMVGNSINATTTLFAGELYDANNTLTHGAFSLSPTNLSSPGPTLFLTTGSTVNLTLTNIGKVGHSFAITDQPTTNATKLFNATIANGTNPVAPGISSSVTFRVGSPGLYYYICQVPGHVELGMWGTVIVVPNATTSIIPTPTPSPSPSPSATASPSPTVSANPSVNPSKSPSPSSSASPSASAKPSVSPTIPEVSSLVAVAVLMIIITLASLAMIKKGKRDN